MSQQVPLTAVAAQTLSINLGSQACQIAVYTLGLGVDAHLYFDLSVAGVPIVNTRICRNVQLLLSDSRYQPFEGDFMFVDTQGDTDPAYAGLGTRYVFLYILPTELTP